MTRHDGVNNPSDGEEATRSALKRLNITFHLEKKIRGLKGDSYDYRQADFYLPDYDTYIEYLGMWDTPNAEKRAEARAKYNEKKRVYDKNAIRCVYIYPRQLGYLRRAITNGLEKQGIKPSTLENPTQQESRTYTHLSEQEIHNPHMHTELNQKVIHVGKQWSKKEFEQRLEKEAGKIPARTYEKPRRNLNKIIGLAIILILIFLVAKNFNKNTQSEETPLFVTANFDITAINLNASFAAISSPEIDEFCKNVCGSAQIFEKDKHETVSLIRCHCEGQDTHYFDLRTKEELPLIEVRGRNAYATKNRKW